MLDNFFEAISHYPCWVFDCDGVILDSNKVKTDAFRQSVQEYGDDNAEAFIRHHRAHGGMSRFRKFEYFFSAILGREPQAGEMETLLDRFARLCREGLLTCDEAPGLRDLMDAIPVDVPRFIVSGGAQDELRSVMEARGLAPYFTAIYGSPDNKDEILERECRNGNITTPGIFIGDAQYDYEAASRFGLDFMFVHGWTEFDGWEPYFHGRDVTIARDVSVFTETVAGRDLPQPLTEST